MPLMTIPDAAQHALTNSYLWLHQCDKSDWQNIVRAMLRNQDTEIQLAALRVIATITTNHLFGIISVTWRPPPPPVIPTSRLRLPAKLPDKLRPAWMCRD
jgi:hypothetical protein